MGYNFSPILPGFVVVDVNFPERLACKPFWYGWKKHGLFCKQIIAHNYSVNYWLMFNGSIYTYKTNHTADLFSQRSSKKYCRSDITHITLIALPADTSNIYIISEVGHMPHWFCLMMPLIIHGIAISVQRFNGCFTFHDPHILLRYQIGMILKNPGNSCGRSATFSIIYHHKSYTFNGIDFNFLQC